VYLDFFKLRDFPFRLTPDTEFLYMSAAHARAKSYLDYTVWNRDGFVVLTGDIGCGKTTLLKKLLSELDSDSFLVAKIFQTQLDEVEFLQAVLVEFGLNPFNAKKVELIDMLNTFLLDSYQQNKQLVLIVDDAHNLGMKVLEEIRMLSGLETQKEKLLHVILVGQPQLNEVLDMPEMEQLLQRVRLRFHLKALTPDETAAYIVHRLSIAGAERSDLFTPETMAAIYKYTGGVPRLINTLCDTALTVAYADSMPAVTIQVIKAAIDELQWQPYDRRASTRRGKNGNRAARAEATEADQTRALANISGRLNQLDSLSPSLSMIADRMASIESLLTAIVKGLSKDAGRRADEHQPARKHGGKESR
jgi:type II secretory pathway predicted ATPase ExeA